MIFIIKFDSKCMSFIEIAINSCCSNVNGPNLRRVHSLYSYVNILIYEDNREKGVNYESNDSWCAIWNCNDF